jgi:membrane protein DedA with SNARE-associated domain
VAGIEHVVQQMISTWYLSGGYLGIVLAMALESCCVPLPSEIVMPLAGFFAVLYPERFSLVGAALAGAVGCLIGSAAAYGIGRAGGRPLLLRYGRYVLISQADSDRADRLFARHGNAVTFFSRLLPVVRTYISLPAGIARMDFPRFCMYTLLGSLPWCLALAWVGTKLGENSRELGTVFHGLDVVILGALAVAVGLYVWRHIRHDRAARAHLAAMRAGAPEHGGPAGAAQGVAAPSPARRPVRELHPPASRLPVPERPTHVLESVSAWPNRYAQPAGGGQSRRGDGKRAVAASGGKSGKRRRRR